MVEKISRRCRSVNIRVAPCAGRIRMLYVRTHARDTRRPRLSGVDKGASRESDKCESLWRHNERREKKSQSIDERGRNDAAFAHVTREKSLNGASTSTYYRETFGSRKNISTPSDRNLPTL